MDELIKRATGSEDDEPGQQDADNGKNQETPDTTETDNPADLIKAKVNGSKETSPQSREQDTQPQETPEQDKEQTTAHEPSRNERSTNPDMGADSEQNAGPQPHQNGPEQPSSHAEEDAGDDINEAIPDTRTDEQYLSTRETDTKKTWHEERSEHQSPSNSQRSQETGAPGRTQQEQNPPAPRDESPDTQKESTQEQGQSAPIEINAAPESTESTAINTAEASVRESDSRDASQRAAPENRDVEDSEQDPSPEDAVSSSPESVNEEPKTSEGEPPISETHADKKSETPASGQGSTKPGFSQPDIDWEKDYDVDDEAEEEDVGQTATHPDDGVRGGDYEPDKAQQRFKELKEQAKQEFLLQEKQREREEQNASVNDADDHYDPEDEGNILH